MNSKLLEQKTEKHEMQMLICVGTKSWWELDERRDLLGSWCCRRSERYGGRSVCKVLKVMVASLNRTPFNRKPVELFEKFIWRQWRCTRMLVQDNWATACWIRWRRAVCLSGVPYRIELYHAEVVTSVRPTPRPLVVRPRPRSHFWPAEAATRT